MQFINHLDNAFIALQFVQSAACRTTRFIGTVAAALTSRRAIRLYRAILHHIGLGIQWAIVALLALGTIAYLLGAGTRSLVYVYQQWADEFVASCEKQPEPEILLLAAPAAPIAALPPAREASEPASSVEMDPWEVAVEPLRILITPPPVVPFTFNLATQLLPPAKLEPAAEQLQPAKRKGGRRKKAA